MGSYDDFLERLREEEAKINTRLRDWFSVLGLTAFLLVGPEIPSKIRQHKEVYVSPEQIPSIFQEEKERIGIAAPIEILLYENNELMKNNMGAYVARHPLEGYVVGLNKEYTSRLTIRHELYHIKAGHADEAGISTLNTTRELKAAPFYGKKFPDTILGDIQLMKWKVYDHPACDIYALTGIKL